MAEESLITEELRKLIGRPGEPIIFKVEEGAIKRYAEAIEDANPLYNDEDYAAKSKYGSLICPPGFTGWPVKGGDLPILKVADSISKTGAPPFRLDGGIEFEFFMPIRAGDTLAATFKISNISERETKSGKMLFITAETTFLNQHGNTAAISRQTLVYF